DPPGPHTLRVHLQMLDKRTPALHIKPTPPNPGTKHLKASSRRPSNKRTQIAAPALAASAAAGRKPSSVAKAKLRVRIADRALEAVTSRWGAPISRKPSK